MAYHLTISTWSSLSSVAAGKVLSIIIFLTWISDSLVCSSVRTETKQGKSIKYFITESFLLRIIQVPRPANVFKVELSNGSFPWHRLHSSYIQRQMLLKTIQQWNLQNFFLPTFWLCYLKKHIQSFNLSKIDDQLECVVIIITSAVLKLGVKIRFCYVLQQGCFKKY